MLLRKDICANALLMLLYFVMAAHAQQDIKSVQTTGQATIFGSDVSAARDQAIIDARHRALEKLGINVTAQTTLSNGMLIDNTYIMQTSGRIHAYRILNENKKNGNYYVTIEAWIKPHLKKDEAKRFLKNYTIVLGLKTSVDGQSSQDSWVEDALREALIADSFQVYDKRQLASLKNATAVIQSLHESKTAARAIGERLLANVIIVGSVEVKKSSSIPVKPYFAGQSEQLLFYRTKISLKAIETSSGRIVAHYTPNARGEKGPGANPDQAVANSMKAAVDKAIPDFLEKIAQYARGKERTVTLSIRKVPTLNDYQTIKRLVGAQRWVQNVQAEHFSNIGVSIITLRYGENIGILAGGLDRLTMLNVESSNYSQINLKYEHH